MRSSHRLKATGPSIRRDLALLCAIVNESILYDDNPIISMSTGTATAPVHLTPKPTQVGQSLEQGETVIDPAAAATAESGGGFWPRVA